MENLVFLEDDQVLTTSLKVAEVFEKRHDHVVRDIETIIRDCQEMASESQTPILGNGVTTPFFQKTSYTAEQGGRKYPMYLMNRDGFSLLVMGFTGKKALKFKLAYVQSFNAMEKKLIELLAERKSEQWRDVRNLSKKDFRLLTDLIRDKLIPLMKAEGCSQNAIRWVYKNYISMIQKLLGIEKGTRDKLPLDLLYELCKVEKMTATIIDTLVAAGNCSKQIYEFAKQKIDHYAQLSLFPNQRLLGEML